jgi:ABC-2 type transport system permease protein
MRSSPSDLKAGIWAFSKLLFRSPWFAVGLVTAPVWSMGIGLTFAIHAPSLLADQGSLRGLSLGAGYFVVTSIVLWNVGHFLRQVKEEGVLHSVVLAGGRVEVLMLARGLTSLPYTALAMALSYVVMVLLLGSSPVLVDPLGAAASFLLLHAVLMSISLLAGSAFIWIRRPWIITNVLQFLLPMSSGMIPVELFPEQIRPVIATSPIAHVFELLRRFVTGVPSLHLGQTQLLASAALSTVSLLAASVLAMRFSIERLRRS